MTVLSDIIAELTTTLHTNTTKDITAAQVKTALIDAFTAIIGAQVGPNDIAAISSLLATGARSATENLIFKRTGQREDVPGVYFSTPVSPPVNKLIADISAQDSFIFTNGVETSLTGAVVTNYFPVVPGTTITISPAKDLSSFAFYDASKTFVSVVAGPFATPQVVTVPTNAYFGRYSAESGYDIQVLKGSYTTLPHPFRFTPASVNMFRPWAGKTWSFHGDSITDFSRSAWGNTVASFHGVKALYNMAISGTGTATLLQEKSLYAGTFTLDPGYWADKDLVYSAMGGNDVLLGTTIGTIDDATTAGTFYGNYKKFIETVLTNNPYCRIVLSTILYLTGRTRAQVQAYNVAIRALCQYYSLHLFDNGEQGSQFSPFTYTALSSDGIHPGQHSGVVGTGGGTSGPLAPYETGSVQVLGSNLSAYLLTVFPVDFAGDPLASFTLHPNEFDPDPGA